MNRPAVSASSHPFFRDSSPPLHIAHRGGSLLAPENTLQAFDMAVRRYGTDMIELDLRLIRDEQLVVFHDETLERCTDGHGPVRALSLSEIERLDAGYRFSPDQGGTFPYRGQSVQVPTFQQVINAFPTLKFNVELKDEGDEGVEQLARLVEKHDLLSRVCVGSEHDSVGEALARRLPASCTFFPRQAAVRTIQSLKSGDTPPSYHHLVLDIPYRLAGTVLVDEALLRAASANGLWVNVWTINERRDMEQLVAMGVGGIMTDRPDVLREVMGDPESS